MKKLRIVAITAFIGSLVAVIIGGLGPMDRDPLPDFSDVQPTGTLLIDVADHLSDEQREHFITSVSENARLNSKFSTEEGLYRVSGDTEELETIRENLVDHPAVEFVEFEQEYQTFSVVPNDPLYAFQWNFDHVDVESAWEKADGDATTVAVIDTGVVFAEDSARGYPALRDLEDTGFAGGYDFVDDDEFPFDEHGHGTHVAGTIAQTTGNKYGVAGLAPNARIMPIRVLNAEGRGSTADIAEAIRYAADNGADIINMSLGGPLPSQLMTDAINHAHRKGTTVIAAAGNNGWSLPSFPAANPHVFAVSATQYDKSKTFYSNYGKYIDIAAPGGNTRVDQNDDGRPDGIMQETVVLKDPSKHEFALYMGTSMASPHVAGVAALIHSQGVTRPERIESIMMESASTDVPNYKEDHYGAGLLSAGAAMQEVYNDHRLPMWLLFLSGFGVLVAFRSKLSGGAVFAAGGIAGLGLLSGFDPLQFLLAQIGAGGWIPEVALAGWHEASLEFVPAWIANNLLLWSAAPIVFLWALFAHVKSRTALGIVTGLSVAWAAMLAAQGLAPTISLAWLPSFQWLETTWLLLNAAIGFGIIWVGTKTR
jgi:serine protease